MRRTWRVIKFILLGAIALLSIVWIWAGISNWQANTKFAAKLEAIRERGLPTSLADLKREPPAPERNAVTYLLEAKEETNAIADAVEKACSDAGDSDEDNSQYDAIWSGHPSPVLLAAIKSILEAHPKAIELLLQASRSPEYDWQYDFDAGTQYNGKETSIFDETLEDAGYKRQAIRVLYYQALVLASNGKAREATEICQAMLRLAGFYATDPLLVNYLVADAVYSVAVTNAINQVLRRAVLSPEEHDALEATLASQDLAAWFRAAMNTERAYSIQCFDEMGSQWPWMLLVWTPAFTKDRVNYVTVFDEVSKTAELNYVASTRDTLAALEEDSGMFSGLILPALTASRAALAKVQAQQRCARVLNQLVAKFPNGKEDLRVDQLGLPSDATTDPFSGQPLVIKHTDAGWLVYSVGRNLQDDGGLLDDRATDVGMKPLHD